MEVIVLDSEVYKAITSKIDNMAAMLEKLMSEKKIADPYMSIEEVERYIGFERKWIVKKLDNREIAYTNLGKMKIKKSAIDAYMDKHSIQPKIK